MLRFRCVTTALLVVGCVANAVNASGQTPDAGKWRVSLVGGLSVFDLPDSGDRALPPPGPPLTTSSPTNPSRQVPTWFLNDGASLLNGTNREFGVAARLVPLDNALSRLGLTGENAPVAGLRLERTVTTRWSIEAGVELHSGSFDLDSQLIEAANATATSFEAAFTGLLTTGPFTNATVSASAVTSGRSSREIAATGAVRFVVKRGAVAPYLVGGGGIISRIGSLPTVTLTGDYAFTFVTNQGSAAFEESDTLVLRFDQGTRLIGIAGAGVSARLSERLDLMIDGRAYIGAPRLALVLDSDPVVTTLTPGRFIESFTTPAVQFSNNPSTGRNSTLSGAPLEGFRVFSASGVQIRYVVTAGVAFRF
jgi:hypothetical protein